MGVLFIKQVGFGQGASVRGPLVTHRLPASTGIIKSMTHDLFRHDAYLQECTATVTALTHQGIVLDLSLIHI